MLPKKKAGAGRDRTAQHEMRYRRRIGRYGNAALVDEGFDVEVLCMSMKIERRRSISPEGQCPAGMTLSAPYTIPT